MIPRTLLVPLVLAMPVLVVAVAVLLGASSLAGGLGDAAGARGIFWWGMASLILLVIDALLLLALLGIRAIDDPGQNDGGTGE